MFQASFLQARKRAAAAHRRFGRVQRQKSRTARVFETTAAIIPAIVCLLHLTLKSANAQPARVESHPLQVETPRSEPGPAQPAPAPLVTVPEPNSLALVTLGLGALACARRAQKPAHPPASPVI